MQEKRKLISFDWAIKRILRSKANFDILEGFLSELLFENITILEILDSESNQESYYDKSNRLDIKVKNSKDEIILVEIQYSSELDYLQRILYATSKVITEHLQKGQKYAQISKVVSISILYFDFGDGDDYIYRGTTNFIGMHNHQKLELNAKQKELYKTQSVDSLYPQYYLIKVKNFDDNAKDTLDEWIHFLKNEEIADNVQAKGLQEAKETLEYLKMSTQEQRAYDARQEAKRREASLYDSTYVIGKIEGHKEGREKGREEGREEEKIVIAKNLLDILDNETIAQKTGLSIEEIQEIRKSQLLEYIKQERQSQ